MDSKMSRTQTVFAHAINHRHGSSMKQEHSFQDRCFRTVANPEIRTRIPLLVGVFDGHDGERASQFCMETFPDLLAKSVLRADTSNRSQDEETRTAAISSAIVCTFRDVDRMFTNKYIAQAIAERSEILARVPPGLNTWQMMQQYPREAAKLEEIQDKTTGGSTAVICTAVDGKLYVANCGDSRAVICQLNTKSQKVFNFATLTVDHDHKNKAELDRLERLGIDRSNVVRTGRLGPVENTRAIGDHSVKGDYKNVDVLSNASGPPVIPDPEITVQDLSVYKSSKSSNNEVTCLILMTDGIYKGLLEIIKCIPQLQSAKPSEARTLKKHLGAHQDENQALAHLIMGQLRANVPRERVAAAIIKFIIHWHGVMHSLKGEAATICRKMDDLTLQIVFDPQNAAFQVPKTVYHMPDFLANDRQPTNTRSDGLLSQLSSSAIDDIDDDGDQGEEFQEFQDAQSSLHASSVITYDTETDEQEYNTQNNMGSVEAKEDFPVTSTFGATMVDEGQQEPGEADPYLSTGTMTESPVAIGTSFENSVHNSSIHTSSAGGVGLAGPLAAGTSAGVSSGKLSYRNAVMRNDNLSGAGLASPLTAGTSSGVSHRNAVTHVTHRSTNYGPGSTHSDVASTITEQPRSTQPATFQ